jgi:hypothetical protein
VALAIGAWGSGGVRRVTMSETATHLSSAAQHCSPLGGVTGTVFGRDRRPEPVYGLPLSRARAARWVLYVAAIGWHSIG